MCIIVNEIAKSMSFSACALITEVHIKIILLAKFLFVNFLELLCAMDFSEPFHKQCNHKSQLKIVDNKQWLNFL